jgi:hypothetical protein
MGGGLAKEGSRRQRPGGISLAMRGVRGDASLALSRKE